MTHTENLVDDSSVTVALLSNPLDWRVRAVEEIVVDAATTCLRRRSLQVAPLRGHLGIDLRDDTTHVLVTLFVGALPRGPLLDFDVSGPDGDGWLVPRSEIADRQALYLEQLAMASGVTMPDDVRQLVAAICGFTGELFDGLHELALDDYLLDGLGFAVPTTTLQEWRTLHAECRDVLRPHLDSFRGYSAPESPALVVPELLANGVIDSVEEANALLRHYRDLLVEIDDRADPDSPNASSEFLTVLSDYANNYDLMVAMKVPVDEPFLVKYSERRDLNLSMTRNAGTQELIVADARTNHVTFKVNDPNLRIRSFKALRPDSTDFAYGAFQSRADPQNRAFYAHGPDRDYRIVLSFRLGLLRRLQLVPYAVAALLLLLSAALTIDRPSDLRTLAVVAGPAALAASVLLAREPSTLGSRLRVVSSTFLASALFVLISVSACLYIVGLN